MGGRSGRGGIALVMVIWALTALAIILSEFVFSSRTSLNAARNQKLESSAYYLALGAVRMAMDEIGRPYQYLLGGEDGGVIFVREGQEVPEDLKSTERSGKLAGSGKYSYRLTDEESKININRLDRKQLVVFFREIGFSLGAERDTIIDSILDWRDPDNLHHLNGAEDDYYQSLVPPYHAKNGNFTTVPELLLVKGVTPQVYHGGGEGEAKALENIVAAHGDRPNYNTAPPEVLTAWLGEAEAQKIVKDRQTAPYKGERGQSYFFRIVAEGRAEGSPVGRRIRLLVNRRGPAAKQTKPVVLQWTDLAPAEQEAAADEE